MPMNRNVMANRVSENWTVIFLKSELFSVLKKGIDFCSMFPIKQDH